VLALPSPVRPLKTWENSLVGRAVLAELAEGHVPLPVLGSHQHAYAQIQAIESARSAYLTQTATPESERYAISMWVIESNTKIAVMKYYSQHPALRFFWPDEVGN